MTVNYVCIFKKRKKIYSKGISGYSQHIQHIKLNNIILRRNQLCYLLKDAAVKGYLREGSSLNIYLRSLLRCAVDQWLCSVSVSHSEIFTG